MEPVRVLLVISTKGWGGTEAYVTLLAKRLTEQGNQVWVATPKKGAVAQTIHSSCVLHLNPFSLFYFWNLLKIVLFLLYHRIEIIHGNSGKDYWLVLLSALLTFRKVVITRHLMTPFSKHTRQIILLSKSKVIAPAQITFDLLKKSGVPETSLNKIYNGIDADRFKITPGKFRPLYRLPADAFITGIVSNIHYPRGKGHLTILQSIPDLLAKIPGAYWMIGGDGPLLPDLMQRVRDLKIGDRVIFTGNLHPNQVPYFLSSLDLFVLLSYDQEGGCPLSIMEAMASSLPVIASSIGGNKEIVEHSRNGYLIAPEDTTNLIKFSVELYEDPAKRKQMGEAGRKTITGFFNSRRMAEETILVYRDTLSQLK